MAFDNTALADTVARDAGPVTASAASAIALLTASPTRPWRDGRSAAYRYATAVIGIRFASAFSDVVDGVTRSPQGSDGCCTALTAPGGTA